MTFDFIVPGQASITMDNCVQDILAECGMWPRRSTPAASTLFDTKDAPKVTAEEVKFFRSYVTKLVYLAKRVRPECIVAVAFLATRMNAVNVDDIVKLKRVLGYVRATQYRGIVLRVGNEMAVHAYIDAAYGVHQSSGKSHIGCAIVLGDAGVIIAKSSKQKIVPKSSTEAELVGLSVSAAQAIHLRNFLMGQEYVFGPAIIHQDNLSSMALIKRVARAQRGPAISTSAIFDGVKGGGRRRGHQALEHGTQACECAHQASTRRPTREGETGIN